MKKTRFKSVMAVVLALMVSVSSLTACTNNKKADTKAPASQSQAKDNKKPAQGQNSKKSDSNKSTSQSKNGKTPDNKQDKQNTATDKKDDSSAAAKKPSSAKQQKEDGKKADTKKDAGTAPAPAAS